MTDTRARIRHDCTKIKYFVCYDEYDPMEGEPECFMKTLKKNHVKKMEEQNVFTFSYDVETYNYNDGATGDGKSIMDMVPYLLVSMVVCYNCIDKESMSEQCEKCGTKRKKIFQLDLESTKEKGEVTCR